MPVPALQAKRGVSRALAWAAVEFARERGARALEGYPATTTNVILEELHVGTEACSRAPASPRSAARRCDA